MKSEAHVKAIWENACRRVKAADDRTEQRMLIDTAEILADVLGLPEEATARKLESIMGMPAAWKARGV